MGTGMLADYDTLKAHPFFAGIDFETLERVAVPIPVEPFTQYKAQCSDRLQMVDSNGDSSGFYDEDSEVDDMVRGALPAQNSDIVDSEMSGFLSNVLAKRGNTLKKVLPNPHATGLNSDFVGGDSSALMDSGLANCNHEAVEEEKK